MERRPSVKGWIFLGLTPLILLYIGGLYRLGGFSPLFALVLLFAIPGAGLLALTGYRLVGSVPAWSAMVLGLLTAFLGCGDKGTAVLIWALCCGGPLAVSLLWPNLPRIRPLAMAALPTAGALWLGGALLYARWHFGTWQLSAVTRRIAEQYLALVEQVEGIYAELYPEGFPEQLQGMLTLMKEQGQAVGFMLITYVSFLLLGSFFGCIWAADRIASPHKKDRWLGSWGAMVPTPGISWIYFFSYFGVTFLNEQVRPVAVAVVTLAGFFYVFAALYTLRCFMRKKNWHSALQFLILFAGFTLSLFTAYGSALEPYSLLLILGLVVTTTPAVTKKILK